MLREGSVDLAAIRWIADYPDADGFVGGLLHSRNGYLAGMYNKPEVDRLIEAGRSEVDPQIRHAIYREIEDIIARETLLIPLFHDRTYRFCHPTMGGFRFGFTVPEVWYEELYARQ